MALIEWNDKFSVQVKELDDQHKKLVELLNSLHDAMKKRESRASLNLILMQLVDYTKYHFAHEEKLMQQCNYADYAAHKQIHETLISKVNGYYSQIQNGQFMLAVELVQFLRDWVINHIGHIDKKYSPCLSAKDK